MTTHDNIKTLRMSKFLIVLSVIILSTVTKSFGASFGDDQSDEDFDEDFYYRSLIAKRMAPFPLVRSMYMWQLQHQNEDEK